jgi:hypothetical protein
MEPVKKIQIVLDEQSNAELRRIARNLNNAFKIDAIATLTRKQLLEEIRRVAAYKCVLNPEKEVGLKQTRKIANAQRNIAKYQEQQKKIQARLDRMNVKLASASASKSSLAWDTRGDVNAPLYEKTSPDDQAEKATAEKATAEKATAEKATAEKATAEKATAEETTADLPPSAMKALQELRAQQPAAQQVTVKNPYPTPDSDFKTSSVGGRRTTRRRRSQRKHRKSQRRRRA